MKLPISWLKDFVDIDSLSVEDIARTFTFGGLEVEEIHYAGLPMPKENAANEFKTSGIGWDRDKIVVAEIREVKPHPNADRLTLLDLFDGTQEQVVLTGAPNIFHLKGTGRLPKPIKVAYAKEGATIYDGHAEGLVLTTLKRAKIRGVESYSMVCSEKELGISEEHEGIILLDDDAPVGTPLVDYMGDAVLEVKINPNMARNANVYGLARELAAMTGRPLRAQAETYTGTGAGNFAEIEITDPQLNPRFVLGLARGLEIKPSPYWAQRRLRLVGVRPISNVVDATNYAMLELGEPLHAFDYDVLKERADKKQVKIITRAARDGEKLVTLDGVERKLSSMNVLVCDTEGPLSIAGVMGGAESEVSDKTKTILLEGAAWNFINIRRTAREHNLPSEASFRFSRGVHPALAETGVRRGLHLMAEWSGGKIEAGLVDNYPLPPKTTVVEISPRDVKRILGIELSAKEIAALLERLEFKCEITQHATRNTESDSIIRVTTPPYRLDIGEGVIGVADLMEEVARLYGMERIPETRLADPLPPQVGNPSFEWDERVRDLLVRLGLQEVVTYRMTSPEREGRLAAHDEYARVANPITPERNVLRRSLLASVLEVAEKNARAESLELFEIGPVFEPVKDDLPRELPRLAIVMTGLRTASAWDVKDSPALDFYDLKGRLELLLAGLGFKDVSYAPTDSVAFLHPGKAAQIIVNGQVVGGFGELHPLMKEKYEVGARPVLVAEFDIAALRALSPAYGIVPVPEFPPVYEDIAVIVDESVAAARVEGLIRQTGGRSVSAVRLFDAYRDEKIGANKKSLAYSLTYQSPDKTMTDAEAAQIRNRIVKRLEHEVGARLRS
ncbi:MAG: phenylalanine--tRNA ligase beta subunit [Anaerolineaceae bacterium]|nr:phenylalanine--tRNA ligase subunit beta [Anaerolineae bacterium]MDL1925934.1 phenylalanine--tRNA ligase subunit beta [Anaerolineae bacterium AMX1]WKZ54356.1 MAG: phenylalanine--tRNA ligase subunit beta [Anaerolineales bacterium]GJQ38787.1 MAG: phenylalanine--tRNA ligase beta subunit [Anaerolineaceae bacterium]HMN00620.1 phenylalanine--tRNA ligase subunit beta [Anaerolineales bacterium]